MVRPLGLVVLCGFLAVGASAQQRPSCKTYFMIARTDPRIPGGTVFGMNERQRNWWNKKGGKKYPGVCYDEALATYAFIWSAESSTRTADIPTYDTRTIQGTVTDPSTGETSTMTGTSSGYGHRAVQYQHTTVSISVLEIVPKEKKQTPPVYFSEARSEQKAMEAAVKFLVTR